MSPARSARSGDFLAEMARASRARARELAVRTTRAELARRARESAAPVGLALAPEGFDVIAEVKFASPSAGELSDGAGADRAAARARAYAAAGACAVSVLTEPERFGGDLAHLEAAAGATRLPVMRKDFLVDPLQILEARAAGASGVLLIARLLPGSALQELLACARELHLFVLLEAFDEADLERCASVPLDAGGPGLLVGVNARDLATLAVDRRRSARLAARLPHGVPAVAESGIDGPEDARAAAAAGYELALVGTALMRAADPGAAIAALLAAGREGRKRCMSW